MSHQRKQRDPQIEDAPAEEDIDRADAAERVELDPDEQVNYPDQPGHPGAETTRRSREE